MHKSDPAPGKGSYCLPSEVCSAGVHCNMSSWPSIKKRNDGLCLLALCKSRLRKKCSFRNFVPELAC